MARGGGTISKPSIARSTAMMSSLTLASRITGFLRIWATAYALGVAGLMSAYSVANNIPNMIFELVAGGIISALFIPTFMELREHKNDADAWRFTSHVFNLAVLGLGILAVIGTVFPQPFVWTQTFRSTGEEAAHVVPAATFFFRFFAIQVVLYGAGAIISALLNSQRRYFWPAVGPVFNNLVAIATMLVFAQMTGSHSGHDIGAPSQLALAVLGGGTTLAVLVMFAVQVPAVFKTGWRYTFGLGLDDPAVRHMLKLAIPTIAYVLTNLVAVSFRNASASAIPGLKGAGVSVLTYAWVFYQLPYGILAVALATAVFTELADAAGKGDMDEFRVTFGRGLRATGVLMLPTSAVMVGLATPLVTLYRVGAFKQTDIPMVAGALRWWAAGLIFYALTMFLLRAFYSLKDTKTPMIVNLVLTVVVQIALYWLLSTGIGGWPGIGVNGIPIADSAFYCCIAFALAWILHRRIGGFDASGSVSVLARMALASVLGGLFAWGCTFLPSPHGILGALEQILAGGVGGLAIALVAGRLLGVAEVSMATSLVARVAGRLRSR